MISTRTPFKNKNNLSTSNILANRNNILGTYMSNISDIDISNGNKKSIFKTVQ
jgi:hypothetical protein